MSRQRVYCCAAIAMLFLLLSVGGSVLTGRQEPPPFVPQPPPGGGAEKEALPPPAPPAGGVDPKIREAEATLDKMCEAYDLKPHPLPVIPDDPPPHAGAMIGYPEVIEPPGRSRERGSSAPMVRSTWVSTARFTSRG